jgi:hypothetical protein
MAGWAPDDDARCTWSELRGATMRMRQWLSERRLERLAVAEYRRSWRVVAALRKSHGPSPSHAPDQTPHGPASGRYETGPGSSDVT